MSNAPRLPEVPRLCTKEAEEIHRFNEAHAQGRADAVARGITSPLSIIAHAIAWVKRKLEGST